jgi:uncharacterized HAD superfamily protein
MNIYANDRAPKASKTSPVIGVDIDGVLGDFNLAFLNRLNGLDGTSWTKDDVTAYDYQECIGIELPRVLAIFEAMVQEGDYALLEPLEGIHLIDELPGKVRLITNRWDTCSKDTLAWLEANNVFRHEDLVFVTGKKSVLGPFDYFVEDAPKNAIDLAAVSGVVFLIDHPYNRGIEYPENVIRVKDWHDVSALIKQMEAVKALF